jgi:hypothetical protein
MWRGHEGAGNRGNQQRGRAGGPARETFMADQGRISQCKATTGRDSGAAAPLPSAVMCAGTKAGQLPRLKPLLPARLRTGRPAPRCRALSV